MLQLQTHFDKLEKKRSQATLARQDNQHKDHMDHVLRETRVTMPTTQAAFECQATEHVNTSGRASFGAPFALNAIIAAATFQHLKPVTPQTTTHAPFQIHAITKQPTVANTLGTKFKTNKCCWRCGYSKKNHSQLSFTFGHNCDHNCHCQDCSKCGERIQDCHDDPSLVGLL